MDNFLAVDDKFIQKTCNVEETQNYREQWINTFCKNKQGVNIKAYLWHIFCSDRYPCIEGDEAIATFAQHKVTEYVALSNDKTELALILTEKPQRLIYNDFYIFPKNMAWTMAFTHEDGYMGPYFAKHKDYERLTRQNNQQLEMIAKKQSEIAKAKENGWL